MKKMLSILCAMAAVTPHASAVSYDYDLQGGSLGFSWQYDDVCGIYTVLNTEIKHWVTVGDKVSCTLSAYGWSLAPNSSYFAYFPFQKSYLVNGNKMTALPISFAGQTQTQNNSTEHLQHYDFMTAQTKSTDDACHFPFEHLGSVLRIECAMMDNCTLKELSISAEEKVLVTSATMDVVKGGMTPSEYEDMLTLKLNDIAVTKGETFVAYMMLAPADLTGEKLTLRLTANDGDVIIEHVKGTEILPGRIYPLTLQMSERRERQVAGSADDDYSVQQQMLHVKETNLPVVTEAVTIKSPTASTSDFVIDTSHSLEQIPKEEDSGGGGTVDVSRLAASPPQSEEVFTTSGIKTVNPGGAPIYIRYGRKYINERR